MEKQAITWIAWVEDGAGRDGKVDKDIHRMEELGTEEEGSHVGVPGCSSIC